MRKFVCETCGSNDLLKKDGVFVCKYCGTQYQLEEAKKIMADGNIDVSGSVVKIDNREKIEKPKNWCNVLLLNIVYLLIILLPKTYVPHLV